MGAGTVVGRLDNLTQETIDKILEVANNPHPKFVVALTPTAEDYSGTMDKTVAEINAAYEAGMEIVFRTILGENSYMDVDCTARYFEGGYTYPSFNGFILNSDNNIFIFAFTGVTNDGTKQTYATVIYSLTPASSGD